ncbi:MAG: fimbrillin family protein, partial [Muribaculaceae bacterium]
LAGPFLNPFLDTLKETVSTKRYWPQSGSLDFFAIVNGQGTPTWKENPTSTEGALTVSNYQVEATPGAQKDFMYAVTPEQATKTTTTLNFRHALSQIEFQAKNQNSKIHVKVTGVKVMNVKNNGTFALPVASTKTSYVGTPTEGDGKNTTLPGNTTINNQGKWSDKSGAAQYTISTLKDAATAINDDNKEVKEVPGNGNTVSLTVTDPANQEYNPNTLYVLPQSFGTDQDTKLWNGTDALMNEGKTDYETTTGAYLILTCQIFNVAGTDYAESTDVAVWGKNGAKDIAVKLPNTEWEQGKRYVYTFTFTESGNGGYNPENNDQVLTPITLSVTVDDFVDGGNSDVDMDK